MPTFLELVTAICPEEELGSLLSPCSDLDEEIQALKKKVLHAIAITHHHEDDLNSSYPLRHLSAILSTFEKS